MTTVSRELICNFEINAKDLNKLMYLKRMFYLIPILIFYISAMVLFVLIMADSLRINYDNLPIFLTINGILTVIALVCSALSFSMGNQCIWGSSEAYKNDDGTVTFIGQSKRMEKISTIRINKIEEYHGFYCLKQNYFKFVFVPLDFPIDQLPVSSIQKGKKK